MFKKIEHIGIAVRNLDLANTMFHRLSGLGLMKIEEVEREGVRTSFFQVGETKIEFLEALRPDTAIGKFIERNGEGMHHIAFLVDDVQAGIDRLQAEGFQPLHPAPQPGADNKEVAFFHPKDTGRVLIEICAETNQPSQK